MTLDPAQSAQFASAVQSATGRRDVCDALAKVYHDLQTRIDERKPLCVASGKCCRFETYGHRLFVTTMELASFLTAWRRGGWSDEMAESVRGWIGTGCPFQIDKLCGVHMDRPFGCRIFFCDPTATQWQQDQYEQFHRQLKQLHETLGVPYYYVEWREALKAAGIAPAEPAVST